MTKTRKPSQELLEEEQTLLLVIQTIRDDVKEHARRRQRALDRIAEAEEELRRVDERCETAPERLSKATEKLQKVRAKIKRQKFSPKLRKIAKLRAQLNQLENDND